MCVFDNSFVQGLTNVFRQSVHNILCVASCLTVILDELDNCLGNVLCACKSVWQLFCVWSKPHKFVMRKCTKSLCSICIWNNPRYAITCCRCDLNKAHPAESETQSSCRTKKWGYNYMLLGWTWSVLSVSLLNTVTGSRINVRVWHKISQRGFARL